MVFYIAKLLSADAIQAWQHVAAPVWSELSKALVHTPGCRYRYQKPEICLFWLWPARNSASFESWDTKNWGQIQLKARQREGHQQRSSPAFLRTNHGLPWSVSWLSLSGQHKRTWDQALQGAICRQCNSTMLLRLILERFTDKRVNCWWKASPG